MSTKEQKDGPIGTRKSLMRPVAVWIQYTNVTDRQTDRQTDTEIPVNG